MNQKELGSMLIKMGEALLNDRERDSTEQRAEISWDYASIFNPASGYRDAFDLQVRLLCTDWHPEDGAAKLARIAGKDAKGVKLGGAMVDAWEYPSGTAIEGKHYGLFAALESPDDHFIIFDPAGKSK